MLVVSLRGVNLRILVPLKACTLKNMKIYLICIFLIRFIYSIHINQVFSFACVLTWSLLVVKKSLGHAQIGLLQGFNSKFLTSIPDPLICGFPSGKLVCYVN